MLTEPNTNWLPRTRTKWTMSETAAASNWSSWTRKPEWSRCRCNGLTAYTSSSNWNTPLNWVQCPWKQFSCPTLVSSISARRRHCTEWLGLLDRRQNAICSLKCFTSTFSRCRGSSDASVWKKISYWRRPNSSGWKTFSKQLKRK